MPPVATLGTITFLFHFHCNNINLIQKTPNEKKKFNSHYELDSTFVQRGHKKRIRLLDMVLLKIPPSATLPGVAPGSPCALRKLKMSWPCHLILRPLLVAVTSHGSDK